MIRSSARKYFEQVVRYVAEMRSMTPTKAWEFVEDRTPLLANLECDPDVTMHWDPRDTAVEYLELFA